ncbi:MAG: IPT/TIG domain-containing protein, partial [Ilumatobacteraceae bacterium]
MTGATVKFGSLTASVVSVTPTLVTVTSPATVSATTVQVTVTTSGGASVPAGAQGAAAADFTYTAVAPTFVSMTPQTGGSAGGTTVAITGSGFITGTTVSFGERSATVVSITPTVITVTSPSTTLLGAVDVQVTNSVGSTDTGGTADDFTYTASVPTVASLDPSTGPVTGNTLVTITGTGFLTGATVAVNGIAATSVSVTSPTTITMRTPASTIAGTVDVQVTTTVGNSSSTAGNGDDFTYEATVPTVTLVSPSSGSTVGGELVTITGTGFISPATVKFGTLAGTSVTVVSATSITVRTPATITPGLVAVEVTTSGGSSAPADTLDDYTFVAPTPTVTSVSPSFGAIAGGTTITLTGTGFVDGASVSFGGTAGTDVLVSSPTQLTVVTPSRPLGTIDVTVTTVGGTSSPDGAGNDFTFAGRPTLTSLSSSAGPVAGGSTMTINGTGFLPGATVSFGTTPGTNVVVASGTQLTVTVPARAAGTVDVTVTTVAGTSATSTASAYRYAAIPAITTLSPTRGTTAGGQTLTITGLNLLEASAVLFNATPGTILTNTDTTITVRTPAFAEGNAGVTVVTAGGTSAAATFEFVAAPVVSSLSPASGTWKGGTSVTVSGELLDLATQVLFGTTPATSFSVNANGTITAVTPPLPVGTVDVTVVTPGGTSAVSDSTTFSYFVPRPVVTSVSPSYGLLAGGDTITLTGTDLDSVVSVEFGGVAGVVQSASETSLTVVNPARGSRGSVDVIVATLATQPSAGGAGSQFTYVTTPTVASVAPTSGTVDGGTAITITGTDFYGVTGVTVGGVAALSVVRVSDTTITAVTPYTSTASTVGVAVTAAGGTSSTSGEGDDFTYTTVKPSITGLSIGYSALGGGGTITITGSGFVNPASVAFGAVPATGVTVVSRTSITATIPAGLIDGPVRVSVTTPGGTSDDTAADNFVYVEATVVDSVTPNQGSVVGGQEITIEGSGFRGVTSVTVGGAIAAFTVVDDTTITATTPVRATPGLVDVVVTAVAGQSSNTAADDYRYFGVPVVASLSPNRSSLAGASVTITGSNLLGVTSVDFGGVELTAFSGVTDTSITVTAPARLTAAVVSVSVTTPGGTSNTAGAADDFRYVAAPTVVSVTPAVGPIAGGTPVTIAGTNFVGVSLVAGVTFNGVPATSVAIVDESTITAVTPAGAIGTATVQVVAVGGSASLSAGFRYFGVPVVSGVSPSVLPLSGGSVTVSGSNLDGVSKVLVGSVEVSSFASVSDSAITLVVPAVGSAASGVSVSVVTPGGTSDVSGTADDVRFVAAPAVTGVSPNRGPVGGGQSVTISGSGFVGVSAVRVGGVSVPFSVSGESSISVSTPAGSVGTVQVEVTATGGVSADVAGDDYRYFAQPSVSALSAQQGRVAGGLSITIAGEHLDGATKVLFGAVEVTAFTSVTDTSITLLTPSTTQGKVDVTVVTPGGTSSGAGTANDFTFYAVLSVTGLLPAKGAATGGTTVVINGTGLLGATSVTFGTTPATSFTVDSSTKITAVAPPGAAGTVDVAIANPLDVSSTTGASDDYTYWSAPTVTGLTPNAGPLTAGTSVVIAGTNFDSVTSVTFEGVAATILSTSLTSITVTAPAGVDGIADVIVTATGGASADTAADDYEYYAAPVVSSLAPASGLTAGGESVVITGSNLLGATAVRFGGTTAAFTIGSDTSITAVAPAGTAGSVSVTVTTPGGTSSAAGTGDDYTYFDVPSISSLTPAKGASAGGNTVVITGTNLTGVTSVSFGGTAATNVVVNSSTQVTATSPAGAAGTVEVTVSNPVATSSTAGTGNDFTYWAAPTITSLSQVGGSTAGGTTVVITGTSFDGVTGAAAVKFGTVNATSYTVNSLTQITAVAPAGTAGLVSVSVTATGGTSANTTADDYLYYGIPTITSFTPMSGPTQGGTVVVITGTNFLGATGVKFGTRDAASFTVNSATQITAVTPVSVADQATLTVANPSFTSAASADKFRTNGVQSATVSTVSPTSASTAGGTTITLTGTKFTTGMSVTVRGVAATNVVVASDTSATAVVPATVTPGAASIVVTNSTGTASAAFAGFSYSAPVPTVSSVSPSSGPTSGGTPVTITGTGFVSGASVKFGSLSATGVVVVSPTQVTAVSPATVDPGTVSVVVTTSGGDSVPAGASGAAADDFEYVAVAPTLVSVSPVSGTTAGNTLVTLTGTGFITGASVAFGGVAGTSVSVVSSTSVTVRTPATVTPGSVSVVVSTSAGSTSAGSFLYSAPVPTVSAVSPASGPTSGGTSVTITGTGFVSGASVKFGSLSATGVVVVSPTQVTAVSPATVTPGTVSVVVTTSGGNSVPAGAQGAAADDFEYVAPVPSVVSVSPASGPTSGGTLVTVTGTGFVTGASVAFDGLAPVAATVVSPTVLSVVSPATVTPGKVDVTVTTTGGTSVVSATDSDDFTYTAVAPTLTSVAPASGTTAGNTLVTLTGTGFITGASVAFGGLAGTSVSVVSATSITVRTPATVTPGAVSVIVTTTAGASGAGSYLYTAPQPAVTSIDPATGPTSGGTSVTITGTGFVTGATVSFGSLAGVNPVVVSSTQITVTAPATTSAGTVAVRVATSGGTSADTSADDFAYAAPKPTVAGVTPATGPTSGGTTVVITGTGFLAASSVTFGALAASSVVVDSPTQITAVAPATTTLSTVAVRVTTSGGTSDDTGSDDFAYTAPQPTVSSVSPSTGGTAGGTAVTITGTGFITGSTVAFGSVAGVTPVVTSPTTITVITPATVTPGAVTVTITAPGGTATGTYTYVASQPTVTSLVAATGPTAGGTPVTITGTGFVTGATVMFGSVAGVTPVVASPTTITVTAPPTLDPGAVPVVVTTAGGSSSATANEFTYVEEVPTVGSISPSTGSFGGGTQVTITGTGFTTNSVVKFDGVPAASVDIVSPTTIVAITPATSAGGELSAQSTGAAGVTVTNGAGTSPAAPGSTFTFDALPAEVASLSTATGPTSGGTAVTITGDRFTIGSIVAFGSVTVPAADVTVVSPTTITVTSPATTALGNAHVTVTNSTGTVSAATPADVFTYTLVRPTVTAVAPTSVSTVGGATVTITGTGFVAGATVAFGTLAAASITSISPTTIVAVAPATITAGTVSVSVTVADGTSTLTSADTAADNLLRAAPLPTVSNVSPAEDFLAGGTPVTITGTGFVTGAVVRFGGIVATSPVVVSPSTITVSVPSSVIEGTVQVTVQTSGGTSLTDGTGNDFLYILAAPTVTSISETSGPATGGTPVNITGTDFVEGSQVFFGDVEATSVTIVSQGEIRALSPASLAGAVDVRVQNRTGISAASDDTLFTFLADGTPTITSVSPSSGSTVGGTVVTILGTNFTAGSTVSFGTLAAASVTVNSGTRITAVSPATLVPGSVRVVVTASGGASLDGASDDFAFVAPVPVVSSVSPSSGSTVGGTVVTITGTGFLSGASVSFGSVAAASVSVVSPTEITAVSPAVLSAGTVRVVVSTSGGASLDGVSDDFAFVAPVPVVSSVSPSSGSTVGGTVVTITGTGFLSGASVSFGTAAGGTVTVVSPTQITAVAPATVTPGAVDVTVTTGGGTSATAGAENDFTYVAPVPTISAAGSTALSPSSGSSAGGTSVTIVGTGFVTGASVSFGSLVATSVTVNSPTSMTVVAPATTALGTINVTVTTSGGTSTPNRKGEYTYTATTPTVMALAPASGTRLGGTSVVITGTGFLSSSTVRFGTVAAASLTVNSPTQITAVSPAGAVGTVDVTVISSTFTSAIAGTGNDFTYFEPPPVVSSLNPSSGTTAGGTSVTINGLYFSADSTVTFGGVAAASVSFVSTTQLTAVTPATTTPGKVDVVVTAVGGTSSATGTGDDYTYAAPVPTVSAVAPNTGPTTGGTSVTITGTGFVTGASVKFGTIAASNVVVVSPTQVTATSPATVTPGLVSVVVTTSGGNSVPAGAQGAAADDFTYTAPAPTLESISPATGTTAGGTSVTITGTGFIAGASVMFGERSAASVTVDSPTQITAVSPATTTVSTVDVVVTTSGGSTSATGTADNFAYTAAVPAVVSLNPATGSTAVGTSVTITGTGFLTGASVMFGDQSAASVT